MSFVIVVTRLLRLLLRPLRQPRIVSEILVSFFFLIVKMQILVKNLLNFIEFCFLH